MDGGILNMEINKGLGQTHIEIIKNLLKYLETEITAAEDDLLLRKYDNSYQNTIKAIDHSKALSQSVEELCAYLDTFDLYISEQDPSLLSQEEKLYLLTLYLDNPGIERISRVAKDENYELKLEYINSTLILPIDAELFTNLKLDSKYCFYCLIHRCLLSKEKSILQEKYFNSCDPENLSIIKQGNVLKFSDGKELYGIGRKEFFGLQPDKTYNVQALLMQNSEI